LKWILIFVLFNEGVHYAQSQPQMYSNYDACKEASVEVKKNLEGTKPNESAYVMSFCVALPRNA